MAPTHSQLVRSYQKELNMWQFEDGITRDEMEQALLKVWHSLPQTAAAWRYKNPPLQLYYDWGTKRFRVVCYIPMQHREAIRILARMIDLYQYLFGRIPWMNLKNDASKKNREDVVNFIKQMFSGYRLNICTAQKVMVKTVEAIEA
ncbi:hypothetical protein C8Q78DRAFT_928851, partial [Trametes maxima]